MYLSEPTDARFARAFLFVLVFGCGLVCGNCWGAMARADDPTPTPLQLALALDVARTAVNEASLHAQPRDVDLVYEATRGNANTDRARLAWLRRHSACTNPRGDCNRDEVVDERDDEAARRRPGNAKWTRNLLWSDARPDNLDGRWRAEWWQRVRDHALARVMRDAPTGVCGMPIRTWGRRSDFASRPGLVAVECGAANLGGASVHTVERFRARRGADRLALAIDPG